jgi:hypothetical protein
LILRGRCGMFDVSWPLLCAAESARLLQEGAPYHTKVDDATTGEGKKTRVNPDADDL